MKLAVKVEIFVANKLVYYLPSIRDDVQILYGHFSCQIVIMKQNRNPVTLFSKKGASIDITLFKAKWEVVALKLAVLLKRGFTYGNYFSNFLRNCFLEVCEQQIVKDYITRTLPPSLSLSLSLKLCFKLSQVRHIF